MSRIDPPSPYRIQGPVTSIAELAKSKPGMVTAFTAEQVAEFKLHNEQMQAREAASQAYAEQNPSKIFAQVRVRGEVVATVWDSGSAGTQHAMSLSEGPAGLRLARTRLAEIVKEVGGQVSYSNFEVPPGPAPAVVPESALPRVTARALNELLQEMRWEVERARMGTDEPGKS